MRVLAIRGSNLASLEGDFEVDFEAEPLASAGIFAITGPTGAGKSTLLDAMCLALFNRLPRLASATAGQVGVDGAEAIRTDDPRAVLRHHAGEGFAEVDFNGRDHMRYRARWAVRRARGRANGQLQNVVVSLLNLDTNEQLGGTRTETLEAIRDRVGLTADQFMRAVMLAQGDFDAFVRADANDRAALLEKLTGTSIYARLGVAAKRKADSCRTELERLEQRIADVRLLDDATRAEADAQLANAQAAHTAGEETLAVLTRERQWHETAATLALLTTQAQGALDRVRAEQTAAAPRRDGLRQRERASALVPQWKAAMESRGKATQSAEQVAALEKAANAAREAAERSGAAELVAANELQAAEAVLRIARPELEHARALETSLSTLNEEIGPLETEWMERSKLFEQAEQVWQAAEVRCLNGKLACTALSDWIAEHEGRRALALRQDVLKSDLDEHRSLTDQMKRLTADVGSAAAEVARRAEDRTVAVMAGEAATTVLQAAQRLAEQKQAEAPTVEVLDACIRTRDTLVAVEPKLSQAERCRERAATLEADLARIEADTAREAAPLTGHREQVARIEGALPVLRGQLEEARRSSELSSAAADDAAERLRAMLVPGEPCPVCGSRSHVADAVAVLIDERAASDLKRLQIIEADLGEQQRAAAVLAERISAGERRIGELTREGQRIAVDLEKVQAAHAIARAALADALTAAGMPLIADLTEVRATFVEWLADADAKRSALATARQAFEVARAEAELHRTKWDNAEAARSRAAEAEREAVARKMAFEQRLTDVCERHDRLTAGLDRELAAHFDWHSAPDANANLAALVAEWREREVDHVTAVAAQPQLAQAVHAAELTRAAAHLAVHQAEEALATLRERRERLGGERAALLGGEATDIAEARMKDAVEAGTVACEKARAAAGTARNELSAAEARLEAARKSNAANEVEAARLAAELDTRLFAMNLTVNTVAAEAQAGEDALIAERAALAALDEAVTRADAERAARERDRANHLATGAPALAADALANAIVAAEAARHEARTKEHEAMLVIRQDDASRTVTASLRDELTARQVDSRVWLQLDGLIGDATGNRFRRFSQGLTLDRLLLHANIHRFELKPRYELQRGTGGDMLVQVVDHDLAGEVRGLHNLSGGERFLVSLALALGLSQMSTSQGLRIESLFIDEGFGALDSESLGAAIAMLEQLHATGRRVGVISHIDEVKERIPVKIAITPVARGRSMVEVLSE